MVNGITPSFRPHETCTGYFLTGTDPATRHQGEIGIAESKDIATEADGPCHRRQGIGRGVSQRHSGGTDRGRGFDRGDEADTVTPPRREKMGVGGVVKK